MTNPIEKPFVVAKLRGHFVPAYSDVTEAFPWIPAGDRFRLQMNGPNGFSIVVPVAPDGSFEVDPLLLPHVVRLPAGL